MCQAWCQFASANYRVGCNSKFDGLRFKARDGHFFGCSVGTPTVEDPALKAFLARYCPQPELLVEQAKSQWVAAKEEVAEEDQARKQAADQALTAARAGDGNALEVAAAEVEAEAAAAAADNDPASSAAWAAEKRAVLDGVRGKVQISRYPRPKADDRYVYDVAGVRLASTVQDVVVDVE